MRERYEPQDEDALTVDLVAVRSTHGVGWMMDADGNVFREVENYTADGRRDISRSHYSVNGRAVSRRAYRKRRRQVYG